MKRKFAITLALGLLTPAAVDAAGTCAVTATNVAFGVFAGSEVTSTGTIVMTCSGKGNWNYTMALSTGGSGVYSSRYMSNGANHLSYNLYSNAAHTQIWGDGTGGSSIVSGQVTMLGQPTQQYSFTVYGLLPAQVKPAPGAYVDTIVVTVTY